MFTRIVKFLLFRTFKKVKKHLAQSDE